MLCQFYDKQNNMTSIRRERKHGAEITHSKDYVVQLDRISPYRINIQLHVNPQELSYSMFVQTKI